MQVRPAEISDLMPIQAAYAHSSRIQRAQGTAAWPRFATENLRAEIKSGLVMLVHEEDVLVGVFSIANEDRAIWGRRESGNHLYLHRIARSPTYHTSGLLDAVLTWAREQCRALGRAGLRLDTWGSNKALIKYYKRQGFVLVGRRRIAVEPALPTHYHGREFALLEEPCRRKKGSRARSTAIRSSHTGQQREHDDKAP